jgi:serine phosphatase RsbU (regulator of sigma subunit)
METARQVQMLFLPQGRPSLEGYQLFDYYKPADAVGGDYFGYTTLPDGQLAIAVGDVAGHGVPAALLMARLCSEARYCLVTNIIPSDAVEDLNRQLSKQGFAYFITFALCVVDPIRHELTVVNAGHMPPLLRRSETGRIEAVGADVSSPPLGIDAGLRYLQARARLEPGDVVMMYTDGVSEARSSEGEMYGIDRIQKIFASATDAQSLGQSLLDDVQQFALGTTQEDDVCVVTFSRERQSTTQTQASRKPTT